MFNDITEIFEKILNDKGNELILNNYKIKDGFYIVVTNYNDVEIYNIEYNKSQNTYFNGYSNEVLCELKEMDLLSNILNTAKAVDFKKKIHSNSIYSFFIKRKTLDDKSILDKSIDLYYQELDSNKERHISLKSKIDKFNEMFGEVDIESLNLAKHWIKENIYQINKKIDYFLADSFIKNNYKKEDSKNLSSLNKKILAAVKDEDNLNITTLIDKLPVDDRYIKIFFTKDFEKLKIENKRYLINRISLKNELNVDISNTVYGVSSFNTSVNSKKKYILMNSRPNKIFNLESIDKLLLINQFNLMLDGFGAEGRNNIYIGDFKDVSNSIKAFKKNEIDEMFNGIYLNIFKSKQVDILDYQSITYYPNIEFIYVDLFNYNEILKFTSKKDLFNFIDMKLFNKFMINTMYTQSIDVSDSFMRNILILGKDLAKKIFIYSQDINIDELIIFIDKYLKECINADKFTNLRNGLSLKYSILNKGDFKMLNELKESIIAQLNVPEMELNQKELLFLTGQLLKYYSKNINNRNNKKFILKLKSKRNIIDLLNKNYSNTSKTGRKTDKVHEYIVQNISDSNIDTDLILIGYISELILFEKTSDEQFI